MGFFGWVLIAGGIASLGADRFGWIEAGRKVRFLRLILTPFRLVEGQWIGGGLHRYLKTSGWFFLLLGGLLVALGR